MQTARGVAPCGELSSLDSSLPWRLFWSGLEKIPPARRFCVCFVGHLFVHSTHQTYLSTFSCLPYCNFFLISQVSTKTGDETLVQWGSDVAEVSSSCSRAPSTPETICLRLDCSLFF